MMGESVVDRQRSRKEEVASRWLAAVRAHVPAARRLPDEIVSDSLPAFLDEIARVISSKVRKDPSAEISRLHARQRAEIPEYTVNQVVLEYRLLRKLLFAALEPEGAT